MSVGMTGRHILRWCIRICNSLYFRRFRLLFYARQITLNVDLQMYGFFFKFEKIAIITHFRGGSI